MEPAHSEQRLVDKRLQRRPLQGQSSFSRDVLPHANGCRCGATTFYWWHMRSVASLRELTRVGESFRAVGAQGVGYRFAANLKCREMSAILAGHANHHRRQ